MIYTLIKKDTYGNVSFIISFDSVTSFDMSLSTTIATQTVERGFNISDNANFEPPTYSIDAVVSNYSLFAADREIIWDGNDFVTSGEPDNESHIKARENIINITAEGEPLTLLESSANSDNLDNFIVMEEELKTGYYKEIPNCVIESVSISTPNNASDAFHVNMKIRQVVIAETSVYALSEEEVTPLLTGITQQSSSTGSSTSSGKVETDDTTGLPITSSEARVGANTEQGVIADRDDIYRERVQGIEAVKKAEQLKESYLARGYFCRWENLDNNGRDLVCIPPR